MKALWNDIEIADAPREELIYIEGNWYFPPQRVKDEYLRKSPTPYICHWKGVCQYFDVGKDDDWLHDGAWSYPEPKESAIHKVKKDFSKYVTFGGGVQVVE